MNLQAWHSHAGCPVCSFTGPRLHHSTPQISIMRSRSSAKTSLLYLAPVANVYPFATMQSLISQPSGTVAPSHTMLPTRLQPSFTVTLSIMMQLVRRTFSSTMQPAPRMEFLSVVLSETVVPSPTRHSEPTCALGLMLAVGWKLTGSRLGA